MAAAYRSDELVRSSLCQLMALALILIDKLEQAFQTVTRNAPCSIKPAIEYFNRYWMTKIKWTLWNVSDVELKTNNVVEG